MSQSNHSASRYLPVQSHEMAIDWYSAKIHCPDLLLAASPKKEDIHSKLNHCDCPVNTPSNQNPPFELAIESCERNQCFPLHQLQQS